VTVVMNLRVPHMAGNFVTSLATTVSFPRILLHGKGKVIPVLN
jgi:hypothetical protein